MKIQSIVNEISIIEEFDIPIVSVVNIDNSLYLRVVMSIDHTLNAFKYSYSSTTMEDVYSYLDKKVDLKSLLKKGVFFTGKEKNNLIIELTPNDEDAFSAVSDDCFHDESLRPNDFIYP